MMNMEFWIHFWRIVLVAALAVFAVLAVVVTIGGFRDVLALFRSIDAQHARDDTNASAGKGEA